VIDDYLYQFIFTTHGDVPHKDYQYEICADNSAPCVAGTAALPL